MDMFWEFLIGIVAMVVLVVVLMPMFWSSRMKLNEPPKEDQGPHRADP